MGVQGLSGGMWLQLPGVSDSPLDRRLAGAVHSWVGMRGAGVVVGGMEAEARHAALIHPIGRVLDVLLHGNVEM